MKKLLNIEDVAEYLSLDTKSVYRLIKNGELAAARIGRVYRVADTDLHAFLEEKKRVVRNEVLSRKPQALQKAWCGSCGSVIESETGIAGRCKTCDVPLCTDCVVRKEINTCKAHQDIDTKSTSKSKTSN